MEVLPYDLPPAELVVEFDPPLSVLGTTCERMTLREPTSAEVRAAEGQLRSGITPEAVRRYKQHLIRLVTGLPPAVVDAVPVSQQELASEYLQNFVTPSRKTGESSPPY